MERPSRLLELYTFCFKASAVAEAARAEYSNAEEYNDQERLPPRWKASELGEHCWVCHPTWKQMACSNV